MSIDKELLKKQREAVKAAKKEEAAMLAQNNNTVPLEDFNLDELEQIDVRRKNMASTIKGFGCITIINHDRCGRRVHLSNAIWRDLGCPAFLKIFLKSEKMIVMADASSGIAVKFDRTLKFEDAVQNYNGKVVLYATETVKRVTAEWKLQFDANCCYTGGTYKMCTVSGKPAIVISMDDTKGVTVAETEEEASVSNITVDSSIKE